MRVEELSGAAAAVYRAVAELEGDFSAPHLQDIARRTEAREVLHHGQRHALRGVGNRFPFGPHGRRYAPPQVGECLLRYVDVEGADGVAGSLCDCGHGRGLPLCSD
jgi:hypothetical protein